MSDLSVVLDEKTKQKISYPKNWKVIFVNDDVTPIDFVIGLLMKVFRHNEESAKQVTLSVHNDGSAVVGVYTFEIAESKSIEATAIAREHGFPLQIKLEEE
jgi:ATP-dependent Clp protease adaptor protein ClpS